MLGSALLNEGAPKTAPLLETHRFTEDHFGKLFCLCLWDGFLGCMLLSFFVDIGGTRMLAFHFEPCGSSFRQVQHANHRCSDCFLAIWAMQKPQCPLSSQSVENQTLLCGSSEIHQKSIRTPPPELLYVVVIVAPTKLHQESPVDSMNQRCVQLPELPASADDLELC